MLKKQTAYKMQVLHWHAACKRGMAVFWLRPFVFRWCGESLVTRQDLSRPSDSSCLGISSKVLYSSSKTWGTSLLLVSHHDTPAGPNWETAHVINTTHTHASVHYHHPSQIIWSPTIAINIGLLHSNFLWTCKAIIHIEMTLFDY